MVIVLTGYPKETPNLWFWIRVKWMPFSLYIDNDNVSDATLECLHFICFDKISLVLIYFQCTYWNHGHEDKPFEGLFEYVHFKAGRFFADVKWQITLSDTVFFNSFFKSVNPVITECSVQVCHISNSYNQRECISTERQMTGILEFFGFL